MYKHWWGSSPGSSMMDGFLHIICQKASSRRALMTEDHLCQKTPPYGIPSSNSTIHKAASLTVPGFAWYYSTISLFHPWSRQWGNGLWGVIPAAGMLVTKEPAALWIALLEADLPLEVDSSRKDMGPDKKRHHTLPQKGHGTRQEVTSYPYRQTGLKHYLPKTSLAGGNNNLDVQMETIVSTM